MRCHENQFKKAAELKAHAAGSAMKIFDEIIRPTVFHQISIADIT